MKFGERQYLSYWGVRPDLNASDSWFKRWHFCDKQQRNSLCLGTVPKYPRQMSELQPIPTTGRVTVQSLDHNSLEDVQQKQHYQCQITSCSQSACCSKVKLGGQSEKYKLPFWEIQVAGISASTGSVTPKWQCVPHSGVHTQQPHINQHYPMLHVNRQVSSNSHQQQY